MASKLVLNVFATDGQTVESTKEYSRKIDAENAGRKSGNAWEVVNGKGAVVSEGAPTAAAVPAGPVARHEAAVARRDKVQAAAKATPKEKAAKALDVKAGKRNPTSGRKVQFGSFNVTGDTHQCAGACGETKPIKAFPTITGRPGVRVSECRTCRNARGKAAKADAAK